MPGQRRLRRVHLAGCHRLVQGARHSGPERGRPAAEREGEAAQPRGDRIAGEERGGEVERIRDGARLEPAADGSAMVERDHHAEPYGEVPGAEGAGENLDRASLRVVAYPQAPGDAGREEEGRADGDPPTGLARARSRAFTQPRPPPPGPSRS